MASGNYDVSVEPTGIEELDEHSCTYFTVDEFSGEMVPEMMAAMAGPVMVRKTRESRNFFISVNPMRGTAKV